MARRKKVYTNISEITLSWIQGKPYGIFKTKKISEVTIGKNMLFMGNCAVAYLNRETKIAYLYNPNQWGLTGHRMGLMKRGGCLRYRLQTIESMLINRGYQVIYVQHYGIVFGLSDADYAKMIERGLSKSIVDKYNDFFDTEALEEEYGYRVHYRTHKMRELCKELDTINSLNQTSGWNLYCGLNSEQIQKIELTRVMYTLDDV